MARPEATFYIGPRVGKKVEARLNKLHESVPGNYEMGILDGAKNITTVGNRLVSVGGEGTNRRVMQAQYEYGSPELTGLLAAGTSNVLHSVLVDAKHVMPLEDFVRAPIIEVLERAAMLNPGVVGDQVFNNHVGTGAFWISQGKMNEAIRNLPFPIPDGLRRKFASLLAYQGAIHDEGDDKLGMFSISPRVGDNPNAFPDQDLFGNLITFAWLEGERFEQTGKIASVLNRYIFKREASPEVYKREMADQFEIYPFPGQEVWIDGDTRSFNSTIEEGKPVQISRSELKFPVIALV